MFCYTGAHWAEGGTGPHEAGCMAKSIPPWFLQSLSNSTSSIASIFRPRISKDLLTTRHSLQDVYFPQASFYSPQPRESLGFLAFPSWLKTRVN